MERFGLLGEHLGHSLSPQIHRFFGDYSYELIEKQPEELKAFFHRPAYRAVNVTIPYKKAVIPFCDVLDETVRRIGSVNTVCFDGDAIRGYNTDYAGFRYLLESNAVPVKGRKALVLGSGGSSVTACCVLRDMEAGEVVVISRSGENHYGNLHRHADAQLIVNTTPVGMFPHNLQAPVSLAGFPQCEAVVDIIYNPLKTQLLMEAEAKGLLAVNGMTMLVAQGKCAAELFLKQPIANTVVQSAVQAMNRRFSGVVLVGMPGCGKSTVGRLLAKALNRPFVDTDSQIEQRLGTAIPDYIARCGEAAFRDCEEQVVAEIGKQLGQVVATGGGAVLRQTNRLALRQNAIVVFLERPLNELATAGRPLSRGGAALEALYEQRLPLYRETADLAIAVEKDPASTCRRILEVLQQ